MSEVSTPGAAAAATESPRSRRNLLRLGSTVAAATAAAALVPRTASAANGGNVVLGANNLGHQTVLRCDDPGATTILIVDHSTTGVGNGIESTAAGANSVALYANSPQGYGVFATGLGGLEAATNDAGFPAVRARNTGGTGLVARSRTQPAVDAEMELPRVGHTAAAVRAKGVHGLEAIAYRVPMAPDTTKYGIAALRLANIEAPDPRIRADTHQGGELDVDDTGALWFCVAPGTPGTWRRLAAPTTAGALVPITPARVFDSRYNSVNGGIMSQGTNRTISVANAYALSSDTVSIADVVPVGATAISYNLTVTNTVGRGFLAVTEGGTTALTASTINWSETGLVLANGTMVKVDAQRQVKVYCGGQAGCQTHLIIDVVGYWL